MKINICYDHVILQHGLSSFVIVVLKSEAFAN